MEDCLFCKIIRGEIPSKKVYEDDQVLAFYDIDPKAPVHVLIIPKTHVQSISHLTEQSAQVASHIMLVVQKLAEELGIAQAGYRLVANTGKDGGQTVGHLHFHLLGGRELGWPPG